MYKGENNNKTERYKMTHAKDVNIALDVLMAIPGNENIRHDGNFFWLTDKQASLLRTMGATFAKMHVKKWIPTDSDSDNEKEKEETSNNIKNLSNSNSYIDGIQSPERKKLKKK